MDAGMFGYCIKPCMIVLYAFQSLLVFMQVHVEGDVEFPTSKWCR